MIRFAVVVFHLALSSALALDLATAVLQLRLNALWERSFYRHVSASTIGFGSMVLVDLAITALELAVVIGYLLRRTWAPVALLAVSTLLLFVVTPSGIQYGLVGVSGLILFEEIRRRMPSWDELFEDEE
jgi:hypothetical protein